MNVNGIEIIKDNLEDMEYKDVKSEYLLASQGYLLGTSVECKRMFRNLIIQAFDNADCLTIEQLNNINNQVNRL